MKKLIMVLAAFECALVLAGISLFAFAQEGEGAEEKLAFTKQVEVLGVHVYATNTTTNEKLLHVAAVLAEYLDNDEDGVPDNPKIMKAMLDGKAAIVMTNTQEERSEIRRQRIKRPRGQGMEGESAHPSARARGLFDGSLEEVLHQVSDVGWGGAYPEVFGRVPGTEVTKAMDRARGGQFMDTPEKYSDNAWYTYDDESCDYDCQASEYLYWGMTSILGVQNFPGRGEEIGNEWRPNTREKMRRRDPALYAILTNPEYKLPKVAPDGVYKATKLKIVPYRK